MTLSDVLAFFNVYFPLLNHELREILERQAHDSPEELAHLYLIKSGEITERVCLDQRIELEALQQALHYYQHDPRYVKALGQFVETQQKLLTLTNVPTTSTTTTTQA